MPIELLALAAALAGARGASAHPLPDDAPLAVEIARATTSLHMEDYAGPYFVSLRLADLQRAQIVYDLGHPAVDFSSRDDELTVEVRVGSPAMDNHPLGARNEGASVGIAYDGDPFATAHEAWRTIDDAYKRATSDYLTRQALRVERGKADYETDDLSPEPPHRFDEPAPADWKPTAAFRAGLQGVSETLRSYPEFLGSATSYDWSAIHRHYLSSEGTRVAVTSESGWLEVTAEAACSDGAKLTARRTYFARRPEELPAWDSIRADAEAMGRRLRERVVSKAVTPFNAPAILDPSISATVFLSLGSRLEGEEQRNPEGGQTYRRELGSQVLPTFLTVIDDPTRSSFGGRQLAGSYKYDEEGVPAKSVALIQAGVLKSFLFSRYPVPELPKSSNGHGRAAPGRVPMARPGNLFVVSERTGDAATLKKELMEECLKKGKARGLWIRRALGWSQQSNTGEHQSFRAMPEEVVLIDAKTGKETLTRGLDLVGTPKALLSRVLRTGDDPEAENFFDDQASGTLPVGVVSPSLLVSEVELQRSEGKPTRPPILPPPKAAREP